MDAIDAITVEIDSFRIIDYKLEPIDAIRIISIYIIIAATSLLIEHHATFIVIRAFNAHSNTTDLFLLFLVISNTCSLSLLVGIINNMILIMVVFTNVFD